MLLILFLSDHHRNLLLSIEKISIASASICSIICGMRGIKVSTSVTEDWQTFLVTNFKP